MGRSFIGEFLGGLVVWLGVEDITLARIVVTGLLVIVNYVMVWVT